MDTETELMSVEYSYDAFISYSQEDREWVRDELLPRLERVGINYIDQFQFELGRPKLNEIERAITKSRKTLLVLSPAYLESDWQQFDSILVSSYGLDTGEWRAVPIVVQPCKLPTRMRALVSIDLSADDADSWQRLINAVSPRSQAVFGSPSLSQKLWEDSRYNDILEEMNKLLGGSDPSSGKGGTGSLFEEARKIQAKRRQRRQELEESDDTGALPSGVEESTKETILELKPINLDEETRKEINHLLELIKIQRDNRRKAEVKINKLGGILFVPPNVRVELENAEDEILKHTQRLKKLLEKVYGRPIYIDGLE